MLQAGAGIAVLFLLFAWLLARGKGLTPMIFADEWYYSLMSRLQPLDKSMLPSWLYLWLFGASNACGGAFLDCVRGANALLFVAAAPFLYLTARQLTGRTAAATIALLATLAPLNLYTVFFMPESSYYFGFCVLSWMALAGRAWPRTMQAAATGAALGAMALLKVHALFLLPALGLYHLYLAWSEDEAWLRRGSYAAVLAGAGTVAVKFGLGWLLAGEAGLSLFGPFYGAAANTAGSGRLLQLIQPFLRSAAGHLMALAILNALPLALLAWGLLRLPRRADAGPASLLRAWTFLTIGAAAGTTILFTATLVSAGSFNEALRLHLRYYSFTLPLLWMVAAAGDAGLRAPASRSAWLRWSLALLLAAVTVLACYRLPGYTSNIVDSPELRSLRLGKPAAAAVAAVQVMALLLWAAGSALGRRLFLYLAVPLTVLSGILTIHKVLGDHIVLPADKAGIYARTHIPAAERGQVTVAGTGVADLMRAQFHIDHPGIAMLELPHNAPIAPYQLPRRNKWLVVFGYHPLPPGVQAVHAEPAFTIVRLDNHLQVLAGSSFMQPFDRRGLVERAEGLSIIEGFGRWSDAKQVVLHLTRPLPKSGIVLIKAMSYGDNAERDFILRSGASSTSFRIAASMQEVAIPFDTDGMQRTLTIDVPRPMAPSAQGAVDTRMLGIGLAEIEVAASPD